MPIGSRSDEGRRPNLDRRAIAEAAKLGHDRRMIATALDAMILVAGALDSAQLELLSDNLAHVAQLLDEQSEAAEAYRAVAALRTLASAVGGQS